MGHPHIKEVNGVVEGKDKASDHSVSVGGKKQRGENSRGKNELWRTVVAEKVNDGIC